MIRICIIRNALKKEKSTKKCTNVMHLFFSFIRKIKCGIKLTFSFFFQKLYSFAKNSFQNEDKIFPIIFCYVYCILFYPIRKCIYFHLGNNIMLGILYLFYPSRRFVPICTFTHLQNENRIYCCVLLLFFTNVVHLHIKWFVNIYKVKPNSPSFKNFPHSKISAVWNAFFSYQSQIYVAEFFRIKKTTLFSY